jgi:hypothetical protein
LSLVSVLTVAISISTLQTYNEAVDDVKTVATRASMESASIDW